jgi:hypothetical protein
MMSKSTRKTIKTKSVPTNQPSVHPPVEYELAFIGRSLDEVDRIEADVTSPLLDAAMHPDGSLRVVFFTRAAGSKDEPGFVLNSFMIASLAAYLREQAVVRASIEPLLAKDLAHVRANGWFKGRGGVWQNVLALQLELVQHPVTTGRAKGKTRADKDTAVVEYEVACRPKWDDHYMTARFRDGKLVYTE